MSKVAIAVLSFISFFLLSSSVIAQTSTPRKSPQVRRLEIQQEIEDKKEALQERLKDLQEREVERKATREAMLTELRQNRIRAYWQRLSARLLATIERLEKIIARIESRIAKIEESDPKVNTSSIKTDLEEAKKSLANIQLEMNLANTIFEEMLVSDNPKVVFKEVRITIQKIRKELVEVHRLLVGVITKIKGLRVGQAAKKSITTTPSVIPSVTPSVTPI